MSAYYEAIELLRPSPAELAGVEALTGSAPYLIHRPEVLVQKILEVRAVVRAVNEHPAHERAAGPTTEPAEPPLKHPDDELK